MPNLGPTAVAGAEACIDGFCHVAEARGEHLRCEGQCAYAEKPKLNPAAAWPFPARPKP